MSHAESSAVPGFEPRRPLLVATLVFVGAALSLCWPMLGGRFLVGPMSDMYGAGYAYRNFAAEYFRQHNAIPPWDPYLFGGISFVGGTHGNIFYPATWLQWLLPTDAGINFAFALHLVLAGLAMYALLRALKISWSGALVGGLAYELTGIVASLVKPGHDGKLFVSALAPFMLLALLRAVRLQRLDGYPLLALLTGLAILGHYQLAYYLLFAAGLWTLWLVFLDPERPATLRWYMALGAGAAAVLIGVGLTSIQILPLLDYIPFSPRGEGGPSGGWEYATAYSMPIDELMSTILPEFNGVVEHYWGDNFFKLHTEYLGVPAVLLAVWGATDSARGKVRWALLGIAVLFLLISFGGHTPFYRLWYLMPMMDKVRAPGMAFYLVALLSCVFAGFGADRLLGGRVTARSLWIGVGVVGGIALLGVVGALQPVAESLADPRVLDRAMANQGELRTGALRLLVVVALTAAICWAVIARRIAGVGAAAGLALITVADEWSVARRFFEYSPQARVLYAADPLVMEMQKAALPFRVLDFPFGGSVYRHSILMVHRVPQVFGYHGQELRHYDELWGGKNVYANQTNRNLLDLFGVRFILMREPQQIPGLTQIAGPARTAQGDVGYLYELESHSPYARVVASAAKLPDSLAVATIIDPRFPVGDIVVLSDTASASPRPLTGGALPPRPNVRVSVTKWVPGEMIFALQGELADAAWLLVGESWFKDWRATVDGAPAPVHRADHAAMAVALPAGAKEIRMTFESSSYLRGRLVSLIGVVVVLTGLAAAIVRDRRRRADG